MSADAGVGGKSDDEARGRHGLLDLRVVHSIDGADEGHGLLDVILMFLVGRVVVVQQYPIEV
eukprot:CAMPEP_0197441110 /NCGR_PEP_ID=MMETSP1175-20131217/7461_1 /TAXON_ID=1003142 /ORGANISM="Triceratium dubium, Strain CCMP147" /LENGTH=61 /DNA_ID=CAMNT_0042971341 /DNA_START=570 /DNA_END=755 /DNA_ORIENTATION=+